MYDRNSPSAEVALAILKESFLRGHSLDSCAFEDHVMSFVLDNAGADTVGGWITASLEFKPEYCCYVGAFIYCHRYLREMFDPELWDDLARMGMESFGGNRFINFVAKGYGVLPDDLEEKLNTLDPVFAAQMQAEYFAELVGDF